MIERLFTFELEVIAIKMTDIDSSLMIDMNVQEEIIYIQN